MKVTVIVCTLNRSQSLAKTLESIAVSSLPDSTEWETLVVDNNSTDQTRLVVEECCRRYPGRFRYVFEPQPGKSFALNTGILQARGEAIAFVDDDVIVEPKWLQNLTAQLLDGKCAGVGGRTLLAEPFHPPRWMALKGDLSLGGVLAAQFDLGDEACELDRAPYGANMAFQKAMFTKYGLFRTDLGPSPNSLVPRPNEDTEFGRRLMAAGERLYYEPKAVVYHPVPKNRIRKRYFLDWYFDYGRANVREWKGGPDIWGIPRRFLTLLKLTATVLPGRILLWMTTISPQRRFFRKCWVWMTTGQIIEVYHQWRKVEPQARNFG